MPVLLRLVGLPEERAAAAGGEVTGGAAAGVRLFTAVKEALGADERTEAGVSVVQGEENKGVCVEAVVVQGVEAVREDWGGDEHVGVVADGRSEAMEAARGSNRRVVLGVRGAGGRGGGGVGGGGGRGDCEGEYNDIGGKKETCGGDDGDEHPASSLSISLSNFTSPGGSMPYLRERFNKRISKHKDESTLTNKLKNKYFK